MCTIIFTCVYEIKYEIERNRVIFLKSTLWWHVHVCMHAVYINACRLDLLENTCTSFAEKIRGFKCILLCILLHKVSVDAFSTCIGFVNWGQCDICGHWTHLKFCSQMKVLWRGSVFTCKNATDDDTCPENAVCEDRRWLFTNFECKCEDLGFFF